MAFNKGVRTMFRHIIEEQKAARAYVEKLAAAVLLMVSALPLVTFAFVTLQA